MREQKRSTLPDGWHFAPPLPGRDRRRETNSVWKPGERSSAQRDHPTNRIFPSALSTHDPCGVADGIRECCPNVPVGTDVSGVLSPASTTPMRHDLSHETAPRSREPLKPVRIGSTDSTLLKITRLRSPTTRVCILSIYCPFLWRTRQNG